MQSYSRPFTLSPVLKCSTQLRCNSPSWQHKLQLLWNLFSLFRSIQHRHWPRLGVQLCTHEWSWPTSHHIVLATRSCELYLLLAPEQKKACVCTWGLTMPTHCTRKEWKELLYYLPSSSSSHQPTECHDYWNTFDGQHLPPLQGSHCWPGEGVSTSGHKHGELDILQGAQNSYYSSKEKQLKVSSSLQSNTFKTEFLLPNKSEGLLQIKPNMRAVSPSEAFLGFSSTAYKKGK